MSDGTKHSLVTATLAALVPPLAMWSGESLDRAACLGAGALAGLLLTPDLDVQRGCKSHAFANRLGIGPLWRVYWWPYGKLASHRGLSHAPLLGTAGRVLYFPWPWLILWWLGMPTDLLLCLLGGLCLADIGHFILDLLDAQLGGRL